MVSRVIVGALFAVLVWAESKETISARHLQLGIEAQQSGKLQVAIENSVNLPATFQSCANARVTRNGVSKRRDDAAGRGSPENGVSQARTESTLRRGRITRFHVSEHGEKSIRPCLIWRKHLNPKAMCRYACWLDSGWLMPTFWLAIGVILQNVEKLRQALGSQRSGQALHRVEGLRESVEQHGRVIGEDCARLLSCSSGICRSFRGAGSIRGCARNNSQIIWMEPSLPGAHYRLDDDPSEQVIIRKNTRRL